jgi:hypothetical protein
MSCPEFGARTSMNFTEAAAFYLALAGMTLIATAWLWG